jgi:hypothetical protein
METGAVCATLKTAYRQLGNRIEYAVVDISLNTPGGAGETGTASTTSYWYLTLM